VQDLQRWVEQSQSSEDFKQLTLQTFEAVPQWIADRSINGKWKQPSASSDMERKSLIGLRVQQISASYIGSQIQVKSNIVNTYDHL